MSRTRKHQRDGIALVAMFALILHQMIAGISTGAAEQTAGILAMPLCTSHTPARSPGVPDQHQPHMPDCCLGWCGVVTGSALVGAAPTLLPMRAAERLVLPLPAHDEPALSRTRRPLNPRAPPTIA
jgi:hypothetical protein